MPKTALMHDCNRNPREVCQNHLGILLLIVEVLDAYVGSPHHLVAKGVEEGAVAAFENLNQIGSSADRKFDAFLALLASSVNGYQEVVVAAFNRQGDFFIVRKGKWANIQAMRSNRYQPDGFAVGVYDRSSYT